MTHTCADEITAPNGSVFLPDLMTTVFRLAYDVRARTGWSNAGDVLHTYARRDPALHAPRPVRAPYPHRGGGRGGHAV